VPAAIKSMSFPLLLITYSLADVTHLMKHHPMTFLNKCMIDDSTFDGGNDVMGQSDNDSDMSSQKGSHELNNHPSFPDFEGKSSRSSRRKNLISR
jgi:hypothetical protein